MLGSGVAQVAAVVKRTERQFICTTPNSFLQLLSLFKDLLLRHREQSTATINKLTRGLKKLHETVCGASLQQVSLFVYHGYLRLGSIENIMFFVTSACARRTGAASQAFERMHNTLSHRSKT
jgi:hypothetical protein